MTDLEEDTGQILGNEISEEAEEESMQPAHLAEKSFKNRFPRLVMNALCSPELPTALFFAAYGLFTPAQQHFIYWRICLYKYNSEAMCQQIDKSPSLKVEEAAVQVDYATFSMIFQIASYLPVMFSALILGTWCDRFSYRIPMILPHIGCLLATLTYILFSFLPNQAMNPVYLGFASAFLGIAGQSSTATVAILSYISRITTGHQRTTRFGILEACLAFGEMIGYSANAFLFGGGQFYDQAFLVQMAINVYAILYILTMVPELHVFADVKARVASEAGGSWFRYLCAPKENVVAAFKIAFGKHPHRSKEKRRWLIVMVATYFFVCVTVGSKPLSQTIYAFVTLQPISLSPVAYAIFQTVWTAGFTFGLFAVLPLLRLKKPPYLPCSDATIGLVGMGSRILGLVCLGLGGLAPAIAPWLYCMAAMCSVFVYISLRSGMSKITENFEHGRMFAVNCLIENLTGLVGGLAFSALYAALVTVELQSTTFTALIHGYTILFVASIAVVPFILFIWLGKQPIPSWGFHQQ